MEVRRVFVEGLEIRDGMAMVRGPMYKYIRGVLRKKVGERVDLIDGKGALYRCIIDDIRGKEVSLKVMDMVFCPEDKTPGVIICVSPIKGPRMDWLIEKATELGVDSIVPTIFRRTLIRLDGEKAARHKRWERIAIEASRQSGRFTVPEITEPIPLREIPTYIKGVKNRWALYEKEQERGIRAVLSERVEGKICVVIGPEGGIEDTEVEWLKETGFLTCSLGDNILRTETVPLVILSLILYELHEWRNETFMGHQPTKDDENLGRTGVSPVKDRVRARQEV